MLLLVGIDLYAIPFSALTNGESITTKMQYIIDSNSSLNFESIQQSNNWKDLQKSNFGYMNDPVWTKTVIRNDTDKAVSFFLRNPRPGMDTIELYMISGGHFKKEILGDLVPLKTQEFMHHFSVIYPTIKAGDTLTVYARLTSIGPTEAGWIYNTLKGFIYFTLADTASWGIFTGAIIALIIYYFTLFHALRFWFMLAYISIGFWSLLNQLLIHGFFKLETFSIPLEIINILNWIAMDLLLLSMLSFVILFFDIKKTMPRIYRTLLFIAVATIFGTLLISPLGNPSLGNIIVGYVAILWYIALLFTGAWAIKLKLPGAWYYMLGQGAFSSSVWMQNLSMVGVLDSGSIFSYLIMPTGSLIDLIFLSMAMGVFIKKINNAKQRLQFTSLAQSKFNTIGKNFSAVMHQWKTPVARLGASISEIDLNLRFSNDETLRSSLQHNIKDMYKNIETLDEVLTDFGFLFKTDRQKQFFKPQEAIKEITDLLLARMPRHNIAINTNINYHQAVYGYPSLFRHVCMTILENAVDIVIERNITDPLISICIYEENNTVKITIEDNGGGIKKSPIESIFEPFESHKEKDSKHYGLGLMIAKMITEEKLNGSLAVQNTKKGACFTLNMKL